MLIYFFAGKYLIYLFIDNPTEDALNTGIQFLKILSPFYFMISIKLVSDGILRGTGKMLHFMVSTFTDLILRVVLAVVLSKFMGRVGIWIAWPIGWGIGMLMSYTFYRTGKWNKNGIEKSNTDVTESSCDL